MKLDILAISVIILLSIVALIVYFISHPCIKEHQEWVHHDAWMQFTMAGKVPVNVYHPAKTSLDTICDLRK